MTIKQHDGLIQSDLMIEARWVATASDDCPLLHNTAIIVTQSEVIDVLPIEAARLKYSASTIACLDEHILIPGLINLHAHAPMSLMRGLADDKPLMTWLNDYIWPTEKAVISHDYVFDASLLSCAEMLAGGITCFNDMYFFPEATADAVLQSGIRANLGITVLDFPSSYANNAEDYLHKGLNARDQWREEKLISTSLAPHAPYTVSDHSFEMILTYADQLSLTIHTHLHETVEEINRSLTEFGQRPIERMFDLGLIGSNLIAAHLVHCTESEIDLMVAHGVSMAHCPTSNLKLGSGIAQTSGMLKKNLNVGLGSDGVASNNKIDLFAEMRLAALLAKGSTQDAAVLPAQQALQMATINGAKALQLEHQIGSIEIGKQADLTAVKLSDYSISPHYDPISHLVYACGREHVTHTWVAGTLRYNNGNLTEISLSQLKDIIHKWQPIISQLKR